METNRCESSGLGYGRLKRQAQCELQNALSLQCGDSGPEGCTGNLTETSAGDRAGIRVRELCVIKHVESLGSELNIDSLVDRGVLGQRQVKVRTSRPAEKVSWQTVACTLNVGNRRKSAAVEIQVSGLRLAGIWIRATADVFRIKN